MQSGRNRQNELIVAVIVVGILALGLLFGIILTLSTPDENPDEDAEATPVPTADVNRLAISDDNPTPPPIPSFPTEVATDLPSPTEPILPTELSTDKPIETPTESIQDTPIPTFTRTIRASNTPSPTPSLTNTASNTPSPTSSRTLRPSRTPSITPSLTFTPSLTRTTRPSPTASYTPSSTFTPSHTPSPAPSLTLTPFPTSLETLTATAIACIPLQDWRPYTIQRGDTLFLIALASGITTQTLRDGNCIEGNTIITGTTILVPPNSPLLNNPPPVIAATEGCEDPTVQITSPSVGATVGTVFTVFGVADYPDWGYYQLELRLQSAPDYILITTNNQRIPPNQALGTIIMQTNYPSDLYWIRISVYNSNNQLATRCAVQVRYLP